MVQIEDYGPGGRPYAKLGLWFDRNYEHAKAVNDLLLEMHRGFEIADTSNCEKFELIVIPGKAVLSGATGAKLDAFAQAGGKIVVIGEGALVAGDTAAAALDSAALRVRPTGGEVVARVHEPYSSRTYSVYGSRRVSLLEQGDDDRYVVHLLYGPPIQRGEVQVLEDFPPVPNATVRLRVPEAVKKVYLIPGERELDFSKAGDTVVEVSVPEFTMHTGVVFDY